MRRDLDFDRFCKYNFNKAHKIVKFSWIPDEQGGTIIELGTFRFAYVHATTREAARLG